jgi:hypothetical protein
MANTPRQGEKSELAVASELIMQGYGVSFPFGHNHQYDLIVDKEGTLYKIQVKTAKNEGGNRYYIPADANHYEKKYVDILRDIPKMRKIHFLSRFMRGVRSGSA